MKTLICAFALTQIFSLQGRGVLFSQNIGINTTGAGADASAMLDIVNANKGLLIPRVSLISNTDVATIASPATSLMVYNTNASMTNGSGTGYYYWDGVKWVPVYTTSVSSGCADACAWTLVAIRNSTTGGVGVLSSGYIVPANKEVLAVIFISSSEGTVALTDAVTVSEVLNPSNNVVSLHSPNFSASTLTSTQMTFAKIKGRFLGSASATAIRVSPSLQVSTIDIQIDGTGLIYLNDNNGSWDASMYIFER